LSSRVTISKNSIKKSARQSSRREEGVLPAVVDEAGGSEHSVEEQGAPPSLQNSGVCFSRQLTTNSLGNVPKNSES
jgi:hypothetical protein